MSPRFVSAVQILPLETSPQRHPFCGAGTPCEMRTPLMGAASPSAGLKGTRETIPRGLFSAVQILPLETSPQRHPFCGAGTPCEMRTPLMGAASPSAGLKGTRETIHDTFVSLNTNGVWGPRTLRNKEHPSPTAWAWLLLHQRALFLFLLVFSVNVNCPHSRGSGSGELPLQLLQ